MCWDSGTIKILWYYNKMWISGWLQPTQDWTQIAKISGFFFVLVKAVLCNVPSPRAEMRKGPLKWKGTQSCAWWMRQAWIDGYRYQFFSWVLYISSMINVTRSVRLAKRKTSGDGLKWDETLNFPLNFAVRWLVIYTSTWCKYKIDLVLSWKSVLR